MTKNNDTPRNTLLDSLSKGELEILRNWEENESYKILDKILQSVEVQHAVHILRSSKSMDERDALKELWITAGKTEECAKILSLPKLAANRLLELKNGK